MKTIRTTDKLKGGTNPFPSILQSSEDERRTESRARIADWIAKSCRFDKDGAGCDDIKEDRYSLRDEGRNPDGSGLSYGERQ